MTEMRLAGLALTFVLACVAQGPFSPPADGPKQPVSGRVVNAETGLPIRGAKVVVGQAFGELASVYSDLGGRFVIEEVPAGEWSVSIIKSGYPRMPQPLVVPATQPLEDVELRFHRSAVIAGRVTDRLDRPVAGANVVVFARKIENGEVVLRRAGAGRYGTQTDDRGEYRVWGLASGPHFVGVFPEAAPARAGLLRFESSLVLYPNATDLAGAEKVLLHWGEVREGINLRLDPPAETRAVLRAVPPRGDQGTCTMCGFQILLEDSSALVRLGGGALGPGNRIAVEGLPPGRYVAGFRRSGASAGERLYGLAKFAVEEAENDPVLVALSGVAPVRGRVVLEDRPAEEQETPLHTGFRAMPPARNLHLGMLDPMGMVTQVQIQGTEAPFEMSCVPGEIELQLMSRDASYIAGITLNGKRLESPKLEIPPEGVPEGLVVRVRFDRGIIEGKLEPPSSRDSPSDLGAGFQVFARPAEPGRSFARPYNLRVLPDGTFRGKLPPGEYEVFAYRTGLQPLASPGGEEELRIQRVTVEPHETAHVTLPTGPADK